MKGVSSISSSSSSTRPSSSSKGIMLWKMQCFDTSKVAGKAPNSVKSFWGNITIGFI